MIPTFRTDLRDRLPLPLARLYRRAFNAKSRLERHHSAYFLLEATVKLAASAQVAAWLVSGNRDADVERRLRGLASPAIGHWVEFLRDVSTRVAPLDPHPFPEIAGVAAALHEKHDDMPALLACVRAMGERVEGVPSHGSPKIAPLDLVNRLPAYRNQTIGHGAIRLDDTFYEELAARLLAAAVETLDRVPLFGKTVLVYVSEVRETPGGTRVADLWDLTGTDALAGTAPGGGDEPSAGLKAGHLYLKRGADFLDLHPLLVCDPTPPEASVRFLNRSATDRDAEYLDYVSGETSKAPHLLEDHRRVLGRVLGTEVTSARLADLRTASLSDHPEPDPEAAATTTRKFGDFEIVSRLGEGGMETVFLARQRSVSRLVALKVLPPAFSHDDVAVARFQRQIQALARADHPNVVRILQSGRTEGTYWFAMEYVEGCDLSDVSKALSGRGSRSSLTGGDLARAVSTGSDRRRAEARGVFPEVPSAARPSAPALGEGRPFFVRLAEIVRDAALGLHHLHERGVIHRDVKPGNLMVTRSDGRAVVIDPGLARVAGEASLTTGPSVLGSIPYAAPEQLQERLLRAKVDARADVYGLGASLYDLATGKAPYEGASDKDLLSAALREAPSPPRRVDRAIPADLDAVIRKAMERDPALRYPSAAALADDLEHFARGEPVVARPPSLGRLVRQWVGRHRAVAATTVMAVLALVAVTLLFLRSLTDERDRAEASAQSEADQRRVTAASLRRAQVMGLLHASREGESDSPIRALLLAREAGRRTTTPTPAVVSRLHAALMSSHERVVLRGHQGDVTSAAFSPSGDRILTACGNDRSVRLWDLNGKQILHVSAYHMGLFGSGPQFSPTGSHILTLDDDVARLWDASGRAVAALRGHDNTVWSARFSHSGDRIVTASADRTGRVWDLEGKPLAVLRGHEDWVVDAAFSPKDDRIVTVSTDGTARLWDGGGQEQTILKGEPGSGLPAVSWSPSGDHLVTRGKDHRAQLWDRDGRKVATLDHAEAAVFSPSGDSLLTAMRGGGIHVWDTTGRRSVTLSEGGEPVTCAAFSPHGHLVVTGHDDGTARVWAAASGTTFSTLRGHEDRVRSVAFSPDGRLIATASDDGTARLWVCHGDEGFTIAADVGLVRRARYSPGGDMILTASEDKTARLWRTNGTEVAVLRGHEAPVARAEFAARGDRIMTASHDSVRLWDLAGTVVGTIRVRGADPPASGSVATGATLTDAAVSPSGERVATAYYDGKVRLWNADGSPRALLEGHTDNVESVAFSPSGARILTASADKTLRLWDPGGRDLARFSGHHQGVLTGVFSPAGDRVASGSMDNTARLWDLAGQGTATLKGHSGWVTCIAFSPQGDRVVTGSNDRTARIWNLAGQEIAVLRGHSDHVESVGWSPSGDRVLTASSDGTARVWDLTGREEAVLRGHAGAVWEASFAPSGDTILTASADGTARVWLVRLEDLLGLAEQRVTRDFTEEERTTYRDLLADPDGNRR